MKRTAFTLIELLVVITIIMVLLALLTPALDKAIYQAMLLRCSANLKAIGAGAIGYTGAFARKYPACKFVGPSYPYGIRAAAAFDAGKDRLSDDRPAFKGFIDTAWLVDPFCQKVDFSNPDPLSEENMYASYTLFFGYYYDGYRGMMKLGDRWEFGDWITGGTRYNFNWLAGDLDIVAVGPLHASASHPDKDGVLYPEYAQAGRLNYGKKDTQQQAQGEAFNVALPVTFSWWRYVGDYHRGKLDTNFAAADGSVLRFNDVPIDKDPRMAHVANIGDQTKPGVWMNVPKP